MRKLPALTIVAVTLLGLTATPARSLSSGAPGRVELRDGTMFVQAPTDRPAHVELASESAEYPDGHVDNWVSFETGRKDDAYTIVAPCEKAAHDGNVEITCPAELAQHVDLTLTDKSDRLTIEYLLRADLVVHGGAGNDKLDALGATTCTVYGGDGNDSINGCQQNTALYGEAGNDKLTMPWTIGRGYPRLLDGGTGFDKISGNVDVDTVACGPDWDRATVQANDVVSDCESVTIRDPRS
jgi:RTX calcium-binding nonapeptide repeat (4 copies)